MRSSGVCRQKSSQRVISNRKLLLVLDLDHTLLNSTRFEEVPALQTHLPIPLTRTCWLLVQYNTSGGRRIVSLGPAGNGSRRMFVVCNR